MKNVTVSLDDETYRRARIRAAELDTSLSALVRDYLKGLETTGTQVERMVQKERELRESITEFYVSENISRDALHERGR